MLTSLYCVSMLAGGYVLLPVATPCAPRCHPAVSIEETWKPPSWPADAPRIVDMSRINELTRSGWKWTLASPVDQPLLVCLTRGKA
jgi:hypothetical protein